MKDNSFESIVTAIISERGIANLDNPVKCNGLLQDYAAGGFKREIRLMLQALEAGYHKELLNSAEPEITRPILVKKFQDEYSITKEAAEEIVGILAVVLKDGGKSKEEKEAEELAALEQSAKKGDIQSQYKLGILLCETKRFEEATVWLKLAAKKGVELWAAHNAKSRGTKSPAPHNMVLIQGGTFLMGSPANEPARQNNEGPQQRVTVRSFYMGKYQVTQKEYQEVMGFNPSYFKGDNLPVEMVRWYDAIKYCNSLSRREGLAAVYTVSGTNVSWEKNANGYRLPTEAEWEYACRAGTTTPYYSGSSAANAGWYRDNSNECTHPVGGKQANSWGLYDMHGNVWEWCWDWYGDYSSRVQMDSFESDNRIHRGGSWFSYGDRVRAAYRSYSVASERDNINGFRVARNVE